MKILSVFASVYFLLCIISVGYSRKYCEYCSSTRRARVDCDRKKKDFEVCDDTQVCGRVDAWVNGASAITTWKKHLKQGYIERHYSA
ncbi:unnamed protein product, partial [Porites evermanni]